MTGPEARHPEATRPEATGPAVPVSSPVTVVGPDATVGDALAVMVRDGIRHLPMVRRTLCGDDSTCIGLLIDRDLLLAVGADPSALDHPVYRWRRDEAPRVAPGDSAGVVARAVLQGGCDAALVVDGDRLVGIVTSTDALRALAREEES